MLEVADQRDDEVDLRTYFQVAARRWKVIVAVTLAVVVLALLFDLQRHPQYRAESEVLIGRSDSAAILNDAVTSSGDAARRLNNELRLFESGTIQAAVDHVYDGPLDPSDVRATVTSDSSDVIRAHLTAGDADAAAELLNLYVKTFISVRRQQRTDELLAVGQEIQQKIGDLDARIAQAAGKAAEPLQTQRSFYQSQLEDLELSADVNRTSGAQVLTAAKAPDSPVSPKPIRDVALAVALGALLGVGLAFLIESLDERIRSVNDLDRISGGRPTLALVPLAEKGLDARFVATRDDRNSPQAEAFRSLRTAVRFAGVDRPMRVIQVTSASQGDGKTTVVANLAVAFAQAGDRVSVACCDLRRPTVQDRFGVDLAPGFTDVLTGDATLEQARRQIRSNLSIMPAGTPPQNPSELLSSERAKWVVGQLAKDVSVLLLDTTPVLPVTDALVVSRMVDATLLVVDSRSTTRRDVVRALQLLDQIGAPVIGLILNGVSESGAYGSTYGYGHSYDERARPTKRTRAPRGAERANQPV